nr:MAG TPA: hypothetical protein [Caudoviricetes sp.]
MNLNKPSKACGQPASFPPSRHATTNTYRTGCGSFNPLAGRGISLTPTSAPCPINV